MLITALLMGDEHAALYHLRDSNVNEMFRLPGPHSIVISPLHWCAKKGMTHMVAAMLQYHANPMQEDSTQVLPIYYAVVNGYYDIVSIIIKHGKCTVDTICHIGYRQTIMHTIAIYGVYDECLGDIMKTSKATNAYDVHGKTAAHYFISNVKDVRLPALYSKMCNPDWNVQELRGLAPMDFAIRENNGKVAEMLLKIGNIHITTRMMDACRSSEMRMLLTKYIK